MSIESSLLMKKYPELITEERLKEVPIKDMPVLFGFRGEIICIPRKREIPSPIGCIGKKGTGKSLLIQRIADESFWHWGINVSIMNDFLEECYDWSFPQNNFKWISQLEETGEIPTPLPIIYVYPSHKKLDLKEHRRQYGLGEGGLEIEGKAINYLKISVPFDEFVDNLNEYMDLKGSEPYLRNILDELKECTEPEEVFNVVRSRIDVGKSSEAVWNKIINYFTNIFDEKVLHITAPDCPEYVSCAEYKGNPFVALLNLGVIPCFITSNLWTERYKAHIYAYHINSIYDAQNKILVDKKKKPVWCYLIFDELTKICSTNEKNKAEEALNNIAARGRMKNIGLIYATQNYEKIPPIIRTNTEYLFCFRHSSRKEVDDIKADFSIMDVYKNELLKLKKLECIGLTSEYFVIYHKDGTITETSEPVRGIVIPSLSKHKLP